MYTHIRKLKSRKILSKGGWILTSLVKGDMGYVGSSRSEVAVARPFRVKEAKSSWYCQTRPSGSLKSLNFFFFSYRVGSPLFNWVRISTNSLRFGTSCITQEGIRRCRGLNAQRLFIPSSMAIPTLLLQGESSMREYGWLDTPGAGLDS